MNIVSDTQLQTLTKHEQINLIILTLAALIPTIAFHAFNCFLSMCTNSSQILIEIGYLPFCTNILVAQMSPFNPIFSIRAPQAFSFTTDTAIQIIQVSTPNIRSIVALTICSWRNTTIHAGLPEQNV